MLSAAPLLQPAQFECNAKNVQYAVLPGSVRIAFINASTGG